MYLCACMYTYVQTYILTCIHSHVYSSKTIVATWQLKQSLDPCVCVQIHTFRRTYSRVHTFTYIQMYRTYLRVPHVLTCNNCRHVAVSTINGSMCVFTHTYIQTCILTCMYAYIHSDVDTHVCHMFTPAAIAATWQK